MIKAKDARGLIIEYGGAYKAIRDEINMQAGRGHYRAIFFIKDFSFHTLEQLAENYNYVFRKLDDERVAFEWDDGFGEPGLFEDTKENEKILDELNKQVRLAAAKGEDNINYEGKFNKLLMDYLKEIGYKVNTHYSFVNIAW